MEMYTSSQEASGVARQQLFSRTPRENLENYA